MGKVRLHLGVELFESERVAPRDRQAIANILGNAPFKASLQDQLVYAARLEIAGSATATVDLTDLTDAFGAALEFGAVAGVAVVNTGANALLWGAAAADGFEGFTGDTAHRRRVHPAESADRPGIDIAYAPGGVAVPAGEHDLAVVNTAAGEVVAYLLVFGEAPA